MVLLVSLIGCKENKSSSDTANVKKEESSLMVNSSKKDLAEIMLYQDYWKDTVSLSRDVYTRLLYIRSDGTISREEELDAQFDVSRMKTTNDGKYWVYSSDMNTNVEVAYRPEKTTKKIFDGTEDVRYPDGDKNRFNISIDDIGIYKNDIVFIANSYSLTRYDFKTKSKKFINNINNSTLCPLTKSDTECYYSGFLPNSKDDEVDGKPKRAIYHFNFNTKKETIKKVVPFNFDVQHRSISENGEVLVFKKENKVKGEDGWDEYLNDSLYFYLNDFSESFNIAVEGHVNLLHLGPLGKWVYFRGDNAVYRISVIKLKESSNWNEEQLIKASECVYVSDSFIKSFKIQNIFSSNE